jgi:hypothetical protein
MITGTAPVYIQNIPNDEQIKEAFLVYSIPVLLFRWLFFITSVIMILCLEPVSSGKDRYRTIFSLVSSS